MVDVFQTGFCMGQTRSNNVMQNHPWLGMGGTILPIKMIMTEGRCKWHGFTHIKLVILSVMHAKNEFLWDQKSKWFKHVCKFQHATGAIWRNHTKTKAATIYGSLSSISIFQMEPQRPFFQVRRIICRTPSEIISEQPLNSFNSVSFNSETWWYNIL